MIIHMIIATLVFTNLLLGFFLFKYTQKIKNRPKVDNQELLSEILSGPAVVKIEVIDKGSLLHWSSKF